MPRVLVAVLDRRALHEIRAWTLKRPGQTVIQRQARAADGIDDHASAVGRIPHLELQLEIERHVAERASLQADVGPLAIGQPRHVVAGADVDVLGRQLLLQLAGDAGGLRDLLRFEPTAFEHVEKIGVAADVELTGPLQPNAAVAEEPRQDAVHDRRANLTLDVIADDRQAVLLEAAPPGSFTGDEYRDAVDDRAAGGERLLHVKAGGLLAADRQVVDEHVSLRLAEDTGDVYRRLRRLVDDFRQVLADAVQGVAAADANARGRHVGKADRVVGLGENGFCEVVADLAAVDVEGGDELEIAHVVAAKVDVHQAGHERLWRGVVVLVDALDQGRGAVADTDESDADRAPGGARSSRAHTSSLARQALSGKRLPAPNVASARKGRL